MFGKIEISADLIVVTGLHIGGSEEFSAIGAIDSPVIRDAVNKEPIIPGSSIKGKVRTLLVKSLSDGIVMKPCNQDPEMIIRLFGGSEKVDGRIPQSRLLFSDCFLNNSKELREKEIQLTEVKFENTINRATAVANPRQIERVVRGSRFGFSLIYNIEKEEDVKEDIENVAKGLKLLEMDYLGGNGSRGYGKIKFENVNVSFLCGELEEEVKADIEKTLKDL